MGFLFGNNKKVQPSSSQQFKGKSGIAHCPRCGKMHHVTFIAAMDSKKCTCGYNLSMKDMQ